MFSFLVTPATPLPQSEYLHTPFHKHADEYNPLLVFGGRTKIFSHVYMNTASEDVIKSGNCPKSISHTF